MNYFKRLVVLCVFLTFMQQSFSQSKQLWSLDKTQLNKTESLKRTSYPKKYKHYRLKLQNLSDKLINAPKRTTINSKSNTIVKFPDADGNLIDFEVKEAPVMSPELSKKFPNDKSYVGYAVNNKGVSVRFSVNKLGVYAMITKAGKQTVYIDPTSKNRLNYIVYKRKNLPERKQAFVCLSKDTKFRNISSAAKSFNANDSKLRTFRLALAATGEYSQYHINLAGVGSGTDAEKKTAVMAAMTTSLTRVDAIYERDLALTMVLVANNDQLIYLDGALDPYSNTNGNTMLTENQTNIDSVIGFANYDIGHVFSTGGGGVAVLNSPCTASKAEGVTGQSNPVGDAFDIDFVAHEMGHQYGATHTFNGDAGSCGGGNRTNATAVEPGSGSTIMAYAGICSPQNVQLHSDDYFHSVSIQQMFTSISTGQNNCAVTTTLNNDPNVPVVSAGTDETIPKSTPFKLTAVGSDADNDVLTYTWEQTDTQITTIPPIATATGGAVFRSRGPIASSTRYFPEIATVLAGQNANTWEVLPSVGRTLNFDVTIRDNVSGGGQTSRDDKIITVDANSGPFIVTSQSTNVTYDVGSTQIITWNVANTDLSPINCTNVTILLSIDGGLTYPVTLASSVLNNGSYDVVIPDNPTNNARIMVTGVDNVFFNVNAADFIIQANQMAIIPTVDNTEDCVGNQVVLNYTYQAFGGFSENTTFSALNLPTGVNASFNPTNTSVSGTNVQLTLTGISDSNLGSNTITIKATATSLSRTVSTNLQIYNTTFSTQQLTSPTQGEIGVDLNPTLSWVAQSNALSYNVQVATDINFTNIITDVTIANTNLDLNSLSEATTYYWRVKPQNNCGMGIFSTIFAFATYQQSCNTVTYSGTPIAIPDNNPTGVSSTLNVADSVFITDINIGVNLTHTFIGDMSIKLTSPANKTVQLLSSSACATHDMNVIFDDNGNSLVCNGTAPGYTGNIKPVDALSIYNGDNAQGTWTLFLEDQGNQDLGSLTGWNAEVCSKVSVPLIVDKIDLKNLKIYPNPTKGLLNIEFNGINQNETEIIIFDTVGRIIKQINFKNVKPVFGEVINLQQIKSGIYFISIINGGKKIIKKIILE